MRSNRLIPACAGKTCGRAPRHRPHHGSSPRVRGKPVFRSGQSAERGLIPACAGKTVCDCGYRELCTAHPRVCGENPHPGDDQRGIPGSSPRVRGKPTGLRIAIVL